MIETLLEDFKIAYEKQGDDLITSNYTLDQGLYIRIKPNGKMESFIFKKEREISQDYDWFAKRDLISKYINSNKCVPSDLYDPVKSKKVNSKRISSNNYLTWFIKKLSFFDPVKALDENQIMEVTQNYYDYLISDHLNEDAVLGLLKAPFDDSTYKFCKNFMKAEFQKIYEIIESKKDEYENYIKVFFDFEYEIYLRESNRYLYHKIFNTDKYNLKTQQGIVGLSNLNMGLNSKKPYLEHKTMNIVVPYRVTLEDALLGYKYGQYLKTQGYGIRYQAYQNQFDKPLISEFDQKQYGANYLELNQNNGEVEIRDFDIVPNYSEKINFRIYNHLAYKDKTDDGILILKNYSSYGRGTIEGTTRAIDELYFFKNLIYNFKKEAKDLSPNQYITKNLLNYLLQSREMLFDFYKKGIKENLVEFNQKVGFELVVEALCHKGIKSGKDAFNLYYSIKDYEMGGALMGQIKELKQQILDKIENKSVEDLETIEEYSFAAGQVAYYLFSKSEAQKKSHDMVEPFMNRNTISQVNEELTYWFKRYAHAINTRDTRFNKMYAMILGYQSEQQKRNDLFLAGYLSDNMMFMKREVVSNEKE